MEVTHFLCTRGRIALEVIRTAVMSEYAEALLVAGLLTNVKLHTVVFVVVHLKISELKHVTPADFPVSRERRRAMGVGMSLHALHGLLERRRNWEVGRKQKLGRRDARSRCS